MREIKFRGIHPNLKQFITGLPAYGLDGEISMLHDGPDNYYDVIPETVGQYTGLKDKNGKEGFESDIVGLEDTLGEQFYGVIKWIGDKKAMYVIEMSGSHYPMSLLSDCEIVGNIYSNPELLEVTP